MAWDDLGRVAAEDNRHREEKWIGVYIAVLAVILAVCATGGDNAGKDATLRNIEAANTWAFFQAKNMRRHVLRLQADELELKLASDAGLSEIGRAAITAKIVDYRRQDEILTRDSERPEGEREGLDQLWVRGKALEALRDIAMRKDPYFDYGEAMLQIAIVLASVALISRHRWALIGMSATLGLLGFLATINGFTLLWNVPIIG
jgi:hypothetical protein